MLLPPEHFLRRWRISTLTLHTTNTSHTMSNTPQRLISFHLTTRYAAQWVTVSALAFLLAACGGGSSNGDGSVGGTVSGLMAGTSVTIQNNSADTLTLTSNAPYTFPTRLPSLSRFNISVLTQPTAQTCGVTFPAGVIPTDGSTVNFANVVCALSSSVGGTVAGLATGASVTLNLGTTALAVGANGAFSFPGVLATGTAYSMTVSAQPTGQTCTLANASGTVAAGAQSQVAVNCQ